MTAVNQVICFLIVFIQLFFNNQVFGQKQELIPLDNPVTMEFLKKNLRKGSPRLVLNHETEKVLKGKLNSDPVIQNIYQAIKINAQEILDKPIINLDIPMEQRTQDNQLDISRDMLYRVNMLGMTYFLEKDKRFLERLNLEVISACNFPSWNPRHFLDVGEMSLAIALALDWTTGDLPGSTVKLAKKTLIEKGLKPSWPENGPQPSWVKGSNNWNQVCHGGMVAAALAVAEEDPKLAAATISRALDGMVHALAQYGPDGVYPEGATYWGYGTSFTVITSSMLESALGTDFGIADYPAFMESAVFRKLSNAPSGLLYNYADCGDRRSRNGDFTLAWFAAKTGNPEFYEKELFLKDAQEMGKLDRLAGAALVWLAQFEEKAEIKMPSAWYGQGPNPVVFFTGGENDPNQYYFGGKGGRGTVSHGNLDAGSFVFELFGVRWSVDPGNYSSYGPIERTGFKLWSNCQECDRWKLLNKNNFGHSTITVNNQLHLVDGKAEIISLKDGLFPEATVDMTPVFGDLLSGMFRKFIKDSPTSLTIEDQIQTSEKTQQVTWQLITQADVRLTNTGAVLTQEGKTLEIKILSHPELSFSVISLDPAPLLLDCKKEGLKRIELNIPAWTIKDGLTVLRVNLSGKE